MRRRQYIDGVPVTPLLLCPARGRPASPARMVIRVWSCALPVFSRDGVNILYIHVPKTGGTSIEFFFERNGFKVSHLDRDAAPDSLNSVTRCSPQHMCRVQLEAFFNLGKFRYIFMTVRDPFARLASTYRMHHAERENAASFEAWTLNTLRSLSYGASYIHDNHIRPQADFFVQKADIFKLEDGFDDRFVQKLSDRLGLSFSNPHVQHQMKSSDKKSPELEMSETTRAVVRVIYARDFQQFGYVP
jgi:hypothetical protein